MSSVAGPYISGGLVLRTRKIAKKAERNEEIDLKKSGRGCILKYGISYDKLKLQGEVEDLRAVEEAFVPSYQTV